MKYNKIKQYTLYVIFYLLLSWIGIALFVSVMELFSVFSKDMPWGAEALGWSFKSPIYYVLSCILKIIIFVFILCISYKKREKHLVLITMILGLLFLADVVSFYYFPPNL